jgi:hypothetical protein
MTDERHIRLHFEGPGTAGHTLPSLVMIRSLQGVQRAIYLLAKEHAGHKIGMRTARVNNEIERNFALICKVPEEGGYALPQEIGDPSGSLFAEDDIRQVALKFSQIGAAIEAEDAPQIRELLPDAGYRRAVISALRLAQPPRKTGIVLSLEDYKRKSFLNGETVLRKLERIEVATQEEEPSGALGYLTGRLIRLDFDKRALSIQLRDGKVIQAVYSEDYEGLLLDSARERIQVFGNIEYDSMGSVTGISGVQEVVELDLSPIAISSFFHGNQVVDVRPPLVFEIREGEDGDSLTVEGEFDIIEAGPTRSALEKLLEEQIEILWVEYAIESDESLSRSGLRLKSELLNRFEVRP